MTRVALILGAGATVADVASASLRSRPPLDKRFFALSKLVEPVRVERVARYIRNTYASEITDPDNDSLEGVMGQIYTDLFNPALEADALVAFRALLQVFTMRLASTTNRLEPTNKRFLYRVIVRYLASGVKPEDLTIVTFNQDIQAEKILNLMANTGRWTSMAERIFSFPGMYQLGTPPLTVSRPQEASANTFARTTPTNAPDSPCIEVLKLHGSLNWYSAHSSAAPSRTAMFKPARKLSVTARTEILPTMALQSTQRSLYTLPVVVPPVTHKSAVLHDRMRQVWARAEECLTRADEVVVFGYSCPPLDFESANLLRRSQRDESPARHISVIDPDSAVVARYATLMSPHRLHYYPDARYFLADHA